MAKQGLKVFENRVLRIILEPWRDHVIRCCRTLHNEEFHDLCPSAD
jgi:hypothetical protein